MQLKTLPISGILVMGVADAMDHVRRGENPISLSNVMATMLSFFVFIAFAVFSVPGGLMAARIGKKKLLLWVWGLTPWRCWCLVWWRPFRLLLACIFLLGVGTLFCRLPAIPSCGM